MGKEIGLKWKDNRRWMREWLPKAAIILPDDEIEDYIRLISKFIVWNGQSFVGRPRLQEFMNFILVTASPAAAKRIAEMLLLIYEKLPGGNPARGLTIEYEVKTEPERAAVTEEQYRSIRHHVMTSPRNLGDMTDMDLLCDILWHTGLTRKDACLLTWQQVDLDKCVIVGRRAKTGTPYHIPFRKNGELHRILLARPLPHTKWVSESNWRRFTYQLCMLDGAMTRACVAAGMPPKSGCHSFRRAFVSRLAVSGANDHDIIKITGHRTTKMIDIYHRASDKRLSQIIDSISDHQQADPQVLPTGGERERPAADQPGDSTEIRTTDPEGGLAQSAG